MTGINPAVVEVSGGNLVLVIVVALIALGALGLAFVFRNEVLAAGEGTDNMKSIAQAVQEGANAYLTRQFRTLGDLRRGGVLPAADAARRRHRPSGSSARSSSCVGAGSPATVGYLGMNLAVRANLRVAAAAESDRPRAGHADRPAHRRHGRHAHRRPGPARRQPGGAVLPGRGTRRARGLRLRCRPARDVHAGRRRHLHQGRRRRRRPGRQGRAEHPRGRPAQRGDDRRQRGRQRRRLRRHGRRPLRVVRRDAGRRADPRLAGLRRQGPRVPAADPRDRRADRGRRCLPHQAQGRRERPDHDQPVVLPLRPASPRWPAWCCPTSTCRAASASFDNIAGELVTADGRPAVHRRHRGGHRHRDVRGHPGAHRLLHRHRAPPGQGRRQDLAHRRGHGDPRPASRSASSPRSTPRWSSAPPCSAPTCSVAPR